MRQILGSEDFLIKPASADASFRSYWRVILHNKSFILMDAPPAYEDCRPFLQVNALLSQAALRVPQIHAADVSQGFLLLEDFGNLDYLDALRKAVEINDQHRIEGLYDDALDALLTMQTKTDIAALPVYDRARLLEEMNLFHDWFLQRHLGAVLTESEARSLDEIFELLADNAIQQPHVFVHRDYHSRNLMVVPDNNPGILDFQDAVRGPVTYDLVSLLRDCYIKWPETQVERWSEAYRQRWQAVTGQTVDTEQWRRWFDLMGIQRHLKATGVFCRLHYRDSKSGYLRDIPRTLAYIQSVAPRHPELAPLLRVISKHSPRVNKTCAH